MRILGSSSPIYPACKLGGSLVTLVGSTLLLLFIPLSSDKTYRLIPVITWPASEQSENQTLDQHAPPSIGSPPWPFFKELRMCSHVSLRTVIVVAKCLTEQLKRSSFRDFGASIVTLFLLGLCEAEIRASRTSGRNCSPHGGQETGSNKRGPGNISHLRAHP